MSDEDIDKFANEFADWIESNKEAAYAAQSWALTKRPSRLSAVAAKIRHILPDDFPAQKTRSRKPSTALQHGSAPHACVPALHSGDYASACFS